LDDEFGAILWNNGNLHKLSNTIAEAIFNNLIKDVEIDKIPNAKFLRMQSIDVDGTIHFRCLLNIVVILSISSINYLENSKYSDGIDQLANTLQQFMVSQIFMASSLTGCKHEHPEIKAGDRLFSITSEETT
jgi:hypothetical protein